MLAQEAEPGHTSQPNCTKVRFHIPYKYRNSGKVPPEKQAKTGFGGATFCRAKAALARTHSMTLRAQSSLRICRQVLERVRGSAAFAFTPAKS
jgi:hypothetical protein